MSWANTDQAWLGYEDPPGQSFQGYPYLVPALDYPTKHKKAFVPYKLGLQEGLKWPNTQLTGP